VTLWVQDPRAHRHWARLEKLLEDALIKVSAVDSKIDTASARDILLIYAVNGATRDIS
jgi:transposase